VDLFHDLSAASGAGAKHMKELISQMAIIGEMSKDISSDPASDAIALDSLVTNVMRSPAFPTQYFMAPLAGA